MKFISPWRKTICYQSQVRFQSKSIPGVSFSIRKVSLAQRIDLSSRIRELTLRNEFLRAGELTDHLDANIADLLVRKLYLEWGLVAIEGLKIDAKTASTQSLVDQGPEVLVCEIADAIRFQMELSDAERKKLLVAFHYQWTSPAAWNCDLCKTSGLVQLRRCAWTPVHEPEPVAEKRVSDGPVWARRSVVSMKCPNRSLRR